VKFDDFQQTPVYLLGYNNIFFILSCSYAGKSYEQIEVAALHLLSRIKSNLALVVGLGTENSPPSALTW
jgi:hypothetical protein